MKTLNKLQLSMHGNGRMIITMILIALTLVFQGCGEDSDPKPNPEADFTITVDAENFLKVTLTNLSENAQDYLWDFGDGNTSTEVNPVHVYTEEGPYDINLTAISGSNESNLTRTVKAQRRYLNEVFTNVATKEGTYGSYGVNTYEFFEPEGDALDQRPLIILAPGGNFSQFTRTAELRGMCRNMAERGYVTALIGYAQISGDIQGILQDFSDLYLLGMRDYRSAVRYFRKNASSYGIDPNRIYVGGWSTGAQLAMATTYITEDKINDISNATLRSAMQSSVSTWGFDNDDNPGVSSAANGALVIMGINYELTHITNDVPLMLINHEKSVTASDCQIFKEEVNIALADGTLTAYGTDLIYEQAQNAGLQPGQDLEYILMDEWQSGWIECDWYPNVSTLTNENYPQIAEFLYNNFPE